MVFKIFSKELQEIINERGFITPTPIQIRGIKPIYEGFNTLLIAPTGLGKTEAVLLPIFDFWLKNQPKQISILYITPLRSLNRDMLKRILWWSEKLNLDVGLRHGDTSAYTRKMQAENPCDLLITTPETLQAILTGKTMRKHLSNIKFVVVDEIHELVENKRGVQLSIALERLREIAGNFQIIGLSATIGSPEEVANFLTGGRECKIVNTAKIKKLEIKVESPKPKKKDYEISSEIFIGPEIAARVRRIDEIIKERRSVLTFTNTREFAEILSSRLRAFDKDLPIETHHSSLSKEVRIKAEDNFKNERLKSLVCTSSLELGIDIGSIDFTLQYMSPRQVTKILQRVGRSGHSLKEVSKGIIISSDLDDCFESTIITDFALRGKIEPTRIYGKSYDVLAHQIVGLSLEEYKIPLKKAFEIIKRAYPFRNLSLKEFLEVCKLLERFRFLWVDDKFTKEIVLKRRKDAWEYYYQNLSTIPDTKNYKIIDIVSNQPVGSLDEEFVALHGTPGTSFICKGQAWKILDIRGNKILAEPLESLEAAIPAWEGELIPVPFEVAQGVGKLRKEIKEKLEKREKNIETHLIKKYPIKKEVAEKLVKGIKKQLKYGFVPTNNEILIEYWENYVILHTCFGSLVNETLGMVLSIILTNKLGSVGLQTDPYRIIIKLPNFNWKEVLVALNEINSKNLKTILELALPNTELFAWKFIHVAKRFGVISKDADYGKAYIRKIISSYSKTLVHKEVLNEIFQEKLDLEKTKEILKLIKNKKISLEVRPGLSYLGEIGLQRRYEIVSPERPEHEILKIFKKRLLNTKVKLICCNCGNFGITYKVNSLPEKIICPKCNAKLIGVIRPYDIEKEKLINKFIKGKELTRGELKTVNKIMDTASLVITYGKDAIKVLAGRGVGPKTAARILEKNLEGDELIKEILKAERNFAKTRRFWKD